MTHRKMSLTQIRSGQTGTVIDIAGGSGAHRRLESMGLRVGKKVKKVSGMPLRGPVTVSLGSTHVSMGHGMASKVIVEVQE